jgi:hypothetical protein
MCQTKVPDAPFLRPHIDIWISYPENCGNQVLAFSDLSFHAPPHMTFLSDLEIVAEALDRHIASACAGAVPVLVQRPIAAIIEDLQLDRFARHGGLEDDALQRFIDRYLETIINLHQPENPSFHQIT